MHCGLAKVKIPFKEKNSIQLRLECLLVWEIDSSKVVEVLKSSDWYCDSTNKVAGKNIKCHVLNLCGFHVLWRN